MLPCTIYNKSNFKVNKHLILSIISIKQIQLDILQTNTLKRNVG